MVISEMMKIIHPGVAQERKAKIKPVWLDVFIKLDKLAKFQLIVCPESSTHLYESIVYADYQALRRMYEHFSGDLSFYDEETIKRFQIFENFQHWAGLKKVRPITTGDVLTGGYLNSWQPRLRFSVDLFGQDQDLPERIRTERDSTDEFIKEVFKRWQSEKDKSFDDWFEEEISQFGIMVLKSYAEGLQRYQNAVLGVAGSRPDHLLASSDSVLMIQIQKSLSESDLSQEEVAKKTIEYFRSNEIKEVQCAYIASMLFASIARKAASGKKEFPTKGIVNDIKTISSLAPYCDAMFIDKECHTYLNEEPLKSKSGLKTRFFSQLNSDEFFEYLDSIEKEASPKHIKKVKEVYGENWGQPYLEMYENQN